MDNETIKELFGEALEVSGALEDFIEAMDENRDSFTAFDDFWPRTMELFEEWGFEDCIELLGAVCSIPRADAKENLEELAKTYGIPAAILGDEDLKEELFLSIQMYVKNYYIDLGNGTNPTKENMGKVAKMLATAFEAFGYGVCNNGLVVVLRTFNHGVVEGLNTDWYTDESEYDAEEFGYYDGVESEHIFDVFFEANSMADLLK